jgi:hypothetical protein
LYATRWCLRPSVYQRARVADVGRDSTPLGRQSNDPNAERLSQAITFVDE